MEPSHKILQAQRVIQCVHPEAVETDLHTATIGRCLRAITRNTSRKRAPRPPPATLSNQRRTWHTRSPPTEATPPTLVRYDSFRSFAPFF
ncbi:hypothetical protein AVEN_164297-1 [Araneus ventricosus]|uniref:Uncharacterized protein n=1 Tax=Araneus ventricosus TaxID=182803 RepID=A0A4Y2GZ66_ARAVE|nr:hypothetical protein AVEN_164297-1 [Araneus ventricosus]